MTKREFIENFVLARARAGGPNFNSFEAVRAAVMAWVWIEKELNP